MVGLSNAIESPVWPLVDTTRKAVYVAGSGGQGTVAVHDPSTGAVTGSITLGGRPHDLGLDPKGVTQRPAALRRVVERQDDVDALFFHAKGGDFGKGGGFNEAHLSD